MSMFELESLVEDSVNTLDGSGIDPWDLRSLYAVMYEFEGRWDTSFTHLRNLDQLIAARFVYRFPQLAQDPTLAELREIVRRTDALSPPMFGSMLADPDPDSLELLAVDPNTAKIGVFRTDVQWDCTFVRKLAIFPGRDRRA